MKSQAIFLSAFVLPLAAQNHSHHHSHDDCQHCDRTGEEVIFTPFFGAAVAVGGSTGDDHLLEEGNHHDPRYDGLNVQGVEAGATLRVKDLLEAHAIYSAAWDREEAWNGHWEEGYVTMHLDSGLAIRAGRSFSSITEENASHSHSRDFVEGAVAHSRFFGEDNLMLDGLELRYAWGAKRFASLGYGAAVEIGHEHEEEVGGVEPRFHGEESTFAENVYHGRVQEQWGGNVWGIFAAYGENGFGRNSRVLGVDWEREVKLAGRDAVIHAEIMQRGVEAVAEDDGSHGSFDELSAAASLRWEMSEVYSLNQRVEWLAGADEAGLEERLRLAANITRHDELFDTLHCATRLQFTADFVDGGDIESTVWLQWVIEFGGH